MKSKMITILIAAIFSISLFSQSAGKFNFNTSHHLPEGKGINSRDSKWDDPLEDVYHYDVLNYEIHIDVSDVTNKSVKGNVVMSANAAVNDFSEIIVDLHDDLAIDSLYLRIGSGSWQQLDLTADLSRDNHRFFIDLGQVLISGSEFSINTYYSGPSIAVENDFGGTNGLSFDPYSQGLSIYTLSEPNESRYWFPCKNIPSDKSFSEMYITSQPYHSAASNGSLIDERLTDEGM